MSASFWRGLVEAGVASMLATSADACTRCAPNNSAGGALATLSFVLLLSFALRMAVPTRLPDSSRTKSFWKAIAILTTIVDVAILVVFWASAGTWKWGRGPCESSPPVFAATVAILVAIVVHAMDFFSDIE